jgi:tetratricopeptide (TPR) repeat protein
MQNKDETSKPPVKSEDETEIQDIEQVDGTDGDQQTEEHGKKPRRRIGRLVALGILGIIVLSALGGLGGYLTAIQDREQHAESIISTEVADQFLLGLIRFERGQYEIALQHFEYVLQIDPDNTAAAEKLTETIIKLGEKNELPTAIPTPTLTPTPDRRGLEELFTTAQRLRDESNWSILIDTLDTLRKQNPEYNAVEVDGLYYLAYRNRGVERIRIQGNLEGGIFDLNRAELFGPLDVEASNYREWATKYITGTSFWGIDWEQVINYFGPLAVSAPYLSDSNAFTSQDRLATAQVEFNLSILARARSRYAGGKWCDAYDLYNQAGAYIQLGADDLSKFEYAKNQCLGIPPTETPGPEPTETPTG